ncbi:Bifunctional apoptosis regulator [Heterocephalus glaber]|uniref:Bifunctional apoptosis regulator n=1 Tax=Heterocephalus glaber TaxID=10181 RepID=G5ATK3_HETGA|nr:Bifunctional apoptosis regulator [Heterocephalus glaber]
MTHSMENSSYKRAILMGLDHAKALGMKHPQNLWEYKAGNPGPLLLYALKRSLAWACCTCICLTTQTPSALSPPDLPLEEDRYGHDITTKLLDSSKSIWKLRREFLSHTPSFHAV